MVSDKYNCCPGVAAVPTNNETLAVSIMPCVIIIPICPLDMSSLATPFTFAVKLLFAIDKAIVGIFEVVEPFI